MMNRRLVLASRPLGEVTNDHFRLEVVRSRDLQEGELLLRVIYLSIDPYMRGRMDAARSYARPVEVGEVMHGETIAQVVSSRHSGFAEGDFVRSMSGWQEYAVSDGLDLRRVDPSAVPLAAWLGPLGMPGLTAYGGLLEVGAPQPDETVVVAAATGIVGSLVGQIARARGARAVGIASGAEKVRALRDEFGFDAAIDRRSPTFARELAAACPDGIDVYFENVGGRVFRAVLGLLNERARVPVCGLISSYNGAPPIEQPPDILAHVLAKRLTFRGFLSSDFQHLEPTFLHEMSTWLRASRIVYREDLVDGIESAPSALIGLLRGENFGKVIVRVAHDEAVAAE